MSELSVVEPRAAQAQRSPIVRAMLKRAFAALLVVGTLAVPTMASAAPPNPGGRAAPPVIKVGAASRSVLPTIDGSHDYLDAVHPEPTDPLSPGLFVPAWDQGRVAVGNGDHDSHWVHDDLEVTAVAFQPQQSRQITVVMAANLYMIFGSDAEAIRERVADLVGPEVASRLEIAISSDHDHHGPDTAFDVNHEWYDLMIDQSAEAVVEAINELRPARLDVAQTDHYFGLRDSRDPQVIDPTLGVLRATATNGETIATMVFWGNHPETTLGWNPTATATDITDECAQINLQPCSIKDRVLTSDFPGWATRIIEDRLGGEAAYFNGAVGDLITPLGANVWEVAPNAPLGLGLVPPAGAQPALGASTFQDKNFRRAYLIGRELATAALERCSTPRRSPRRASTTTSRRSTRACRTSASASWRSAAPTVSRASDTPRRCSTRARRPVRRTTPRAPRTRSRRRPTRCSARSASVTTRGRRSRTCASARWAS